MERKQTHTMFNSVVLKGYLSVEEESRLWLRMLEEKGEHAYTKKIDREKSIRYFVDIDFTLSELGVGDKEELKGKMREVNESIKRNVEKIVGRVERMVIANRLYNKEHIHFPELIVSVESAKKLSEELEKRVCDSNNFLPFFRLF